MVSTPMDVLTQFPIRKSKAQKRAFRAEIMDFAQKHGYPFKVERGMLGAQNLVIGDPEKARYLVTAHYDTPASIGIPNFITPCNLFLFLVNQIFLLGWLWVVSLAAAYGIGYLLGMPELTLLISYPIYYLIFCLLIFGPANRHNANDNTSGVVTVLEILTSLPENQRDKVAFVLFDLEEAGLIGSASYRKAHKAQTDRQIVLNLDCVGDGDVLMLFPTAKLRKQSKEMDALDSICRTCGEKEIRLHRKGFAYCPSDHSKFPNGVGIMAFHEKKGVGLYCGRIHTARDIVLEITNVNILRAAIISMISDADK